MNMTRYNSIRAFLKTLPREERNDMEWSLEVLMVQYWEILTKESDNGKDHGGITIPYKDHFLSIALKLEWKNLKLNASVQDVQLLDNYELASKNSNTNYWQGSYH
jgi:hypothetical protein